MRMAEYLPVALLVAAMGDPGNLIDLVPGAGYHGLVFGVLERLSE